MILTGNYFCAKIIINELEVDLEAGQSILLEDSIVQEATVLWLASAIGCLPLVKLLIKRGANINHSTTGESTPLRVACYNNRVDIIRYLLKHGACVESANSGNNTCIMIAAFKGHFQVVRNLFLIIFLIN